MAIIRKKRAVLVAKDVKKSPENSAKRQTLSEDMVDVRSSSEWRRWLQKNHKRGTGVWLVLYKKGSRKRQMDYNLAVEEGLCFGWIDSKPRKLNSERSLLWFTPRKPKTGWSANNKRRVEMLVREGRMTKAGTAAIQRAKQDGSWNKLDEIEALKVPDDLLAALERNKGSMAHFESFPRSVKRSILEWILNAKREETRKRRIEETARLAAQGIRANQWRQ
jgi:uncharacterized protein YdeI (YjbR/CyaY-like superfamily)